MASGRKLETNFIIEKFLELSESEQAVIYEQVNSDDPEKFVRGGVALVELLMKNSKEMAKSVGSFDEWIVFDFDVPSKAACMYQYFKDNLKKTDNGYRIAVIS